MPAPQPGDHLPPGVRSSHVADLVLPEGFTANMRLGQLVDVRDPAGGRYLLGDTGDRWTIHRRLTPDAAGHARNHVEHGPPLSWPKEAAPDA